MKMIARIMAKGIDIVSVSIALPKQYVSLKSDLVIWVSINYIAKNTLNIHRADKYNLVYLLKNRCSIRAIHNFEIIFSWNISQRVFDSKL